MKKETIRFTLNGEPREISVDPELTLLWVLRDQFGLTGTKYGCGIGYCGACTVIIDRVAVRSCSVAISEAAGSEILTIEGLSRDGLLHPLQEAFLEKDALQCGYCTPGMVMNAYGLLLNNPEPTRLEVIEGMEDNLCRCGAHIRIIEAIQAAGKVMNGGKKS
jgi:aerobic-type carbon monoxide dehydrogenase small subunit (CoxS/CutS family)